LKEKGNSEQFAATGQRLAKLEMLCNNQREEIKAKVSKSLKKSLTIYSHN